MLPIVFINLDSDIVRREAMEVEFRECGGPFTRLSATRWTDLTTEEGDRLYSAELNARLHHKPLVNGEKGCYASHLRAWQWLLDSPHVALVVLEDDVRITPRFTQAVQALAAQAADGSAKWDMVKLIGRSIDGKPDRVRLRQSLCDGLELIEYARIPSRTAGYVVTRQGAQKLLASRVPFGRPVDVDLRFWWENGLRVLGVFPDAIGHNEITGNTTISRGESRATSMGARLRKARLKAAYNLLDLWHRRRFGRPE